MVLEDGTRRREKVVDEEEGATSRLCGGFESLTSWKRRLRARSRVFSDQVSCALRRGYRHDGRGFCIGMSTDSIKHIGMYATVLRDQ